MSNNLPFMLMTPIQAAHFRQATLGEQHRLEPMLIEGGQYKGSYALAERNKSNPAHATHLDAFGMLSVVVLDTEIAWPPAPDEAG